MYTFIAIFCALCVIFKSAFVALPFTGGVMLLGILLLLSLFLYWARKQATFLVITVIAIIALYGYLSSGQVKQKAFVRVKTTPRRVQVHTTSSASPSNVPGVTSDPCAAVKNTQGNLQGWTPLKQAIFTNNVQQVLMLLNTCGADPNIADTWNTALQYGSAEVITALMEKGMKIPNDQWGTLALAYAGQTESMKKILARGDMEHRSSVIVEGGKVYDVSEKLYLLPWAVAGGNIDMVNLLLTNEITQSRALALQTAVNTGRAEIVRLLTNLPEPLSEMEQKTLMRFAAERGQVDVARALLDAGIDVNTTDPFHFGQTSLFIAARQGDIKMMQMLLAAGANPDLADTTQGQTPLHEAVQNGNLEAVRILVEAGSSVNGKNARQNTPLQLASRNPEIADYLRAHGAR